MRQSKSIQRKARLEASIEKFTRHADELEAVDPVTNAKKIAQIRLAIHLDREELAGRLRAPLKEHTAEVSVTKKSLLDRLFGPLT